MNERNAAVPTPNEPVAREHDLFGHESPDAVARRVFAELGGNVPTRVVTQTILDRDLLPEEMRPALLFRGVNDLVRRALTHLTAEKLPFAQATGANRRAPWKQLDLFTKREAFALIRRRRRSLYDDDGELIRLHGWCLDKFGDAPWIPAIPPVPAADQDDLEADDFDDPDDEE